MEPIFVLDLEFNRGEALTEIGICMVMELDDGKLTAARPPQYLIKIGEEPKISLLGACEMLKNMGTERSMWASWGVADRHELKQRTQEIGVAMPVGYFHIDIGPMYAALMKLDRPIKLKRAAEELTGRFYGSQHHADDDAFNAARVLASLMNRMDRP